MLKLKFRSMFDVYFALHEAVIIRREYAQNEEEAVSEAREYVDGVIKVDCQSAIKLVKVEKLQVKHVIP